MGVDFGISHPGIQVYDVEWKQELKDDGRAPNWRELHLDATYPMRFFSKKPDVGVGHYRGKRWHEQYGSIDGFGNGDGINNWLLTYVDLGSRTVKALHYPDDASALERYNERYREYMRTLDLANPSISYYRGWDRSFRAQKDEPKRVSQGMSLSGLGLKEVVLRGSSVPEESESFTIINLYYEEPQGDIVGRRIDITDEDKATSEVFWTERRRVRRAGEGILRLTLELVQDAVTKSSNGE